MEDLPTIALTGLAGNELPQLNWMQSALLSFTDEITVFWWFVWFMTAILLVRHVYRYGKRAPRSADDLYSESLPEHQ